MGRLFTFFYTLLALIIYILSIPILLYKLTKQKYRISIPSRFFRYNNSSLPSDGVWFHTCSYGESLALAPIIARLPKELLRATTITETGYGVISSYTPHSRYLPFEILLFGWQRRQKVLVVMEAELWYLMLLLAKKGGAKTILINARVSDRSYQSYMRYRWLYRRVFALIDEVYAQTQSDKLRLESLGAERVEVIGNIKLSQIPNPTKKLSKPDGLLVNGASTHDGEEELILEAFVALKSVEIDTRLIVVPRHPDRFDEVASLIDSYSTRYGYSWHRYSSRAELDSDIVLIDVMGELVNLYAISDIVILGGAFVPIGGHNATEAAQFGCKIISGEHYFNQEDIFSAVEGIEIVGSSKLTEVLLAYRELEPTSIKELTSIDSIVRSIEDVL